MLPNNDRPSVLPARTNRVQRLVLLMALSCLLKVALCQSVISSSPASGPVNSIVSLTGSNFSSIPSANAVFFGCMRAEVISATPGELKVKVPAGSSYAPISVTTNGLISYSRVPFVVTFPSAGKLDTTFLRHRVDIPAMNAKNLIVADFDGDYLPDLLYTSGASIAVVRHASVNQFLFSAVFESKVEVASVNGVSTVEVGDVDGDGKPDILAAAGTNLHIFKNVSAPGALNNASFSPPVIFATNFSSPDRLLLRDLDSDGKQDIAMVDHGSAKISIMKNVGSTGQLTPSSLSLPIVLLTPDRSATVLFDKRNDIAASDLDGDGKPELILTDFEAKGPFTKLAVYDFYLRLTIFKNQSDAGILTSGSFATGEELVVTTKTGYPSPTPHYGRIFIADFNNDGKPDISLADNMISRSVVIAMNNSSIGIMSFIQKTLPLATCRNIAVADFDGDSWVDLTCSTTDWIFIISGRADGLNLANSFQVGLSGSTGEVQTGDLNADGVPELMSSQAGTALSIFFNSIGLPHISAIEPGIGLPGDTISISGTLFDPVTSKNKVSVSGIEATVLSSSSTNVTLRVPDNAVTGPIALVVNGRMALEQKEFVVTHIKSVTPSGAPVFSKITILGKNFDPVVSGTTIKFNGVDAKVIEASSTSLITEVPAGATSGVITVVSNGLTSQSSIEFTVAPPPILKVTPSFGPVGSKVTLSGRGFNPAKSGYIVHFGSVAADITGVSDTSITVIVPKCASSSLIRITSNGLISSSASPFHVTFQNPIPIKEGAFKYSKISGAWAYPSGIEIADFDADGLPDIFFIDRSDTFSIVRNLGNGAFASKLDFPILSSGSEAIKVGDIDGDGKPDVVALNSSPTSLTVYRNISSTGLISKNSFAPGIRLGGFLNPSSLFLNDLDRDGKIDVIAAYDNSIAVFRNASSATAYKFSRIDITTGYLMEISDIDGDRKSDFIVRTDLAGGLAVWQNQTIPGTITKNSFVNKAIITTGVIGIHQVYAADMDNDLKPDLVLASPQDSAIFILTNLGSGDAPGFGPKQRLPLAHTVSHLTGGDLNGDEKTDLLLKFTGYYSGAALIDEMLVLENTSTKDSFKFEAGLSIFSPPLLSSIIIADLNNDSLADIAATGYGQVFVFKRTTEPSKPFLIEKVTPTFGLPGDAVEITVSGEPPFGEYSVKFNNAAANILWNGSAVIIASVPPQATTGPVSVTIGLATASGPVFSICSVAEPIITESFDSSSVFPTLNSSASEGNQWFKDGIELSGETSPHFVVTESGNYSVQVTETSGCKSPVSKEYIAIIAGVDESLTQLNVYPNPADAAIAFELRPARAIHIWLYDNFGRVVLTSTGNSEVHLIDISHLKPGVYYFRCQQSTGVVFSGKLQHK